MSKQQHHIFLVEDDADDRHLMEEAFRDAGFEQHVKMFSTSDGFLKEITAIIDPSSLPSLIVLDFNMPGINGGELLVHLKENATLKHIPVVIYSTGMRPILREILLSSGALECFEKGMEYHDFCRLAKTFRQLVEDKALAC